MCPLRLPKMGTLVTGRKRQVYDAEKINISYSASLAGSEYRSLSFTKRQLCEIRPDSLLEPTVLGGSQDESICGAARVPQMTENTLNSDINPPPPRIYGPFPALVRGVEADGQRFTINTVLDHLSPTDFYLCLDRQVETFARLLAITKILTVTVALRGTVLHVEPQEDALYGLTVAITRHRFLR